MACVSYIVELYADSGLKYLNQILDIFRIEAGAGERNRTAVSCLEGRCNNRYTTPAKYRKNFEARILIIDLFVKNVASRNFSAIIYSLIIALILLLTASVTLCISNKTNLSRLSRIFLNSTGCIPLRINSCFAPVSAIACRRSAAEVFFPKTMFAVAIITFISAFSASETYRPTTKINDSIFFKSSALSSVNFVILHHCPFSGYQNQIL